MGECTKRAQKGDLNYAKTFLGARLLSKLTFTCRRYTAQKKLANQKHEGNVKEQNLAHKPFIHAGL